MFTNTGNLFIYHQLLHIVMLLRANCMHGMFEYVHGLFVDLSISNTMLTWLKYIFGDAFENWFSIIYTNLQIVWTPNCFTAVQFNSLNKVRKSCFEVQKPKLYQNDKWKVLENVLRQLAFSSVNKEIEKKNFGSLQK